MTNPECMDRAKQANLDTTIMGFECAECLGLGVGDDIFGGCACCGGRGIHTPMRLPEQITHGEKS